jgi:hypothetical protein
MVWLQKAMQVEDQLQVVEPIEENTDALKRHCGYAVTALQE